MRVWLTIRQNHGLRVAGHELPVARVGSIQIGGIRLQHRLNVDCAEESNALDEFRGPFANWNRRRKLGPQLRGDGPVDAEPLEWLGPCEGLTPYLRPAAAPAKQCLEHAPMLIQGDCVPSVREQLDQERVRCVLAFAAAKSKGKDAFIRQ